MAQSTLRIPILLAEDDALLREFLIAKLSDQEDFAVVGSVGNGREVLEAVVWLKPQVLLLDLGLPELSGLSVMDQLAEIESPPSVLVLTGNEAQETQLDAARRGAKGFLCKSEAGSCLVDAIRAVAAGEPWFARPIIAQVLNEYPALTRQAQERDRPINQLSEREREVLVRVGQGMSNDQIAKELYASQSTVKAHLRSVFRKLDLTGRTEAAVYAVREGLV
jgi:DNA-binding NarL/FixJ family response regulator